MRCVSAILNTSFNKMLVECLTFGEGRLHMNSNLDPIRILRHKMHDLSVDPEGFHLLRRAAAYLEKQNEPEEKIALWIEGRL